MKLHTNVNAVPSVRVNRSHTSSPTQRSRWWSVMVPTTFVKYLLCTFLHYFFNSELLLKKTQLNVKLFLTLNIRAQPDNFKRISIYDRFFSRRIRDPIRVPRIRENYHRVPTVRENRVPRIREIGSLQIHTGFLTFCLKKP